MALALSGRPHGRVGRRELRPLADAAAPGDDRRARHCSQSLPGRLSSRPTGDQGNGARLVGYPRRPDRRRPNRGRVGGNETPGAAGWSHPDRLPPRMARLRRQVWPVLESTQDRGQGRGRRDQAGGADRHPLPGGRSGVGRCLRLRAARLRDAKLLPRLVRLGQRRRHPDHDRRGSRTRSRSCDRACRHQTHSRRRSRPRAGRPTTARPIVRGRILLQVPLGALERVPRPCSRRTTCRSSASGSSRGTSSR